MSNSADEKIPIMEPNFPAFFRGGRYDGFGCAIATAQPIFGFIDSDKDETGKIIARQFLLYRLERQEGRTLFYEFVRSEPWVGQSKIQM